MVAWSGALSTFTCWFPALFRLLPGCFSGTTSAAAVSDAGASLAIPFLGFRDGLEPARRGPCASAGTAMELSSVSAFGAAGVAPEGAEMVFVSASLPPDTSPAGFDSSSPTDTLSGEARNAVRPSTTSGLALGFVLAWDDRLRDDWRRGGGGSALAFVGNGTAVR